jgi:hypothetical protein
MTWATALGAMCGMVYTFLAHCKLHLSRTAEPLPSGNREAGLLPNDKNWRHEDASEMMFDDMMRQYNLDIPPEDIQFIKALIAGDGIRCRSAFMSISGSARSPLCRDEKSFLFEIVANKRNGIDVDK